MTSSYGGAVPIISTRVETELNRVFKQATDAIDNQFLRLMPEVWEKL